VPHPRKGQRSRVDLEWLGDEEWRCRNCDAILSEGVELLHHRHRDCRHPQSESRAVARESTCVGCRAALAQVRALREPAMAAVTAAAAAAAADAGGAATGEHAAECERALWGEGAAWRRVFASSVVPEPTAEPGRGGIMGRMTAGSLACVLSALQLRTDDVFFDIGAGNGAVLGAVHLLAPTMVIALSDGGDTAMRVLGQEAIAFTGEAGSGVAFLSELWHRTERASEGVWKLAIFYGYMLGTRRPRAEPSRAP
jgi:hypothetical protein